jgi:hypothetical protein
LTGSYIEPALDNYIATYYSADYTKEGELWQCYQHIHGAVNDDGEKMVVMTTHDEEEKFLGKLRYQEQSWWWWSSAWLDSPMKDVVQATFIKQWYDPNTIQWNIKKIEDGVCGELTYKYEDEDATYDINISVQSGEVKGFGRWSIGKLDVSEIEDMENMMQEYISCTQEAAENLATCTPFSCSFIHPFWGGEPTEKTIVGMQNEKCIYTEELPNGWMMNCDYAEQERLDVSTYYKELMTEEWWYGLNISFSTNEVNQIKNPLQNMLDNEVCIISGY